MFLFNKKEIVLSEKNYVDYLPVGTIVKLYNDNEDNEYMIYRYMGNFCMPFKCNNKLFAKSHVYKANNKYYHPDYVVCLYPFGVGLEEEYYILHDDVKDIVFNGYDDEYRKSILNEIDNWGSIGDKNE